MIQKVVGNCKEHAANYYIFNTLDLNTQFIKTSNVDVLLHNRIYLDMEIVQQISCITYLKDNVYLLKDDHIVVIEKANKLNRDHVEALKTVNSVLYSNLRLYPYHVYSRKQVRTELCTVLSSYSLSDKAGKDYLIEVTNILSRLSNSFSRYSVSYNTNTAIVQTVNTLILF